MIPLSALPWLLVLALLSFLPDFNCSIDPRNFEGERYTSICGARYQRPETMVCVEVSR